MKRLLASFFTCIFVTGLLCTMTGCPSDSAKKTTVPAATTPAKTPTT